MDETETEALLQKLRGIVEGDSGGDLTAKERARLRQMLTAYDTILASGKAGRWIMVTVITLGASIAAGIKLLEYLVQLGGGKAP